jgi:D-glycero-alpha-D-manno-heptose-7-phosphate kinase
VILTRTPFPVCLAGGGSDEAPFYRSQDGGATTSIALDRFFYVLVGERFDPRIRVVYSKTEEVAALDDLEHGLIREAMRLAQVHRSVEVHTLADTPGEVPAEGSSSSVAVGLLNALYRYKGKFADPSLLAEDASRIEINVLHETNGKRNPYAAAFGGVHYFEFRPDDTVRAQPIQLAPDDLDRLASRLSLFYVGPLARADPKGRSTEAAEESGLDGPLRQRQLARAMRDALAGRNWDRAGELLNEGWTLQREGAGRSKEPVDEWYAHGIDAGAIGGTATDVGGGRFLLLLHPPERSAQVAKALSRLERMPVRISPEGSRVLMVHG